MNIEPVSLFFQLCAWNLATLKRLIGYKFERKNISRKGTSIENIRRFELWKEQKTQWIQHKPRCRSVGNFPSKEQCTNYFRFLTCWLFAHEIWQNDVVGRPQIKRRSQKRNSKKNAKTQCLKARVLSPKSNQAHAELRLLYQSIYQSFCSAFSHSRMPLHGIWIASSTKSSV